MRTEHVAVLDIKRDLVQHVCACRIRCARSCMDFTLYADDIEFRRLRVDDDKAFNIYTLAEFAVQVRAWTSHVVLRMKSFADYA